MYPQIQGYLSVPANPSTYSLPDEVHLRPQSIVTDFLSFDSNAATNMLIVSPKGFTIIEPYLPASIILKECRITRESSSTGRLTYFLVYIPCVVDDTNVTSVVNFQNSKFWITDLLGNKEKEAHAKTPDEISNLSRQLADDIDQLKLISASPLCLRPTFAPLDVIATNYFNFDLYISLRLESVINQAGLTGLDILPTNRIAFG